MKKTILALAGILALGTTALVADGSQVTLEKNTILNGIYDSEITDSTVGVEIKAKDSTVTLIDNTVDNGLGVAGKVIVENSTLGVTIDAKNHSTVQLKGNKVINVIGKSTIKHSTIGLKIVAE